MDPRTFLPRPRPGVWACAALLLASPLGAAAPTARPQATPAARGANPFFAFCMDTHDSEKRTLAEQAALLKELGYDGAGHLWLAGLPERLKTLEAAGLKLFQVYLRVNIAPGKRPYDPALKKALPLLEGRGVMLALLVNGGRPSDPAGDARAAALVGEIADLARKSGARVALYPHAGFWLERVEDAVRLARKVDRPNVGVMFNLCHWLKTDGGNDVRRVLSQAKDRLFAVGIHGADTAGEIRSGKGKWIQPLGSGSYDMYGLLRLLDGLGYGGPIGLQCYGLRGDARKHLAQSMAAWQALRKRVLTARRTPPAASRPARRGHEGVPD